MSDFVDRLLGAGGADGPPIRPLIGSLFEPRRRMQVWLPQAEPPLESAELAAVDSIPPVDVPALPAAEPSDLSPSPPAPTEPPG
ncbi:hypothetical protein AB0O00_36305, partial [Kitasatospora sp. NPDC093558]